MRNDAENCKTAFKTSKSITELDGVWITIPLLNLKKREKGNCWVQTLPLQAVARFQCSQPLFWYQSTVLARDVTETESQFSNERRKILSGHKCSVHIVTFGPKHKFRRACLPQQERSRVERHFQCSNDCALLDILDFFSCCQHRLKYPFWFPSFINEHWLPGYNFKQV